MNNKISDFGVQSSYVLQTLLLVVIEIIIVVEFNDRPSSILIITVQQLGARLHEIIIVIENI